jgi:prepilin-type N-terminal cleavage/methylation domain-containing protein
MSSKRTKLTALLQLVILAIIKFSLLNATELLSISTSFKELPMKIITIKNPQTKDKNPNLIQQAGFTLIELSIVLVIIGLIVGGVLVGQDLIKAAEIRATISQYEKYNAAMNTFRTKYNGMPGDLSAISQAGSIWAMDLKQRLLPTVLGMAMVIN